MSTLKKNSFKELHVETAKCTPTEWVNSSVWFYKYLFSVTQNLVFRRNTHHQWLFLPLNPLSVHILIRHNKQYIWTLRAFPSIQIFWLAQLWVVGGNQSPQSKGEQANSTHVASVIRIEPESLEL